MLPRTTTYYHVLLRSTTYYHVLSDTIARTATYYHIYYFILFSISLQIVLPWPMFGVGSPRCKKFTTYYTTYYHVLPRTTTYYHVLLRTTPPSFCISGSQPCMSASLFAWAERIPNNKSQNGRNKGETTSQDHPPPLHASQVGPCGQTTIIVASSSFS